MNKSEESQTHAARASVKKSAPATTVRPIPCHSTPDFILTSPVLSAESHQVSGLPSPGFIPLSPFSRWHAGGRRSPLPKAAAQSIHLYTHLACGDICRRSEEPNACLK